MIGFLLDSSDPALFWVTLVLETKEREWEHDFHAALSIAIQDIYLWPTTASFLVQNTILEAQLWKLSSL